MKKLSLILIAFAVVTVLGATSASATAFNVCPNVGFDTAGCQLLITVTAVNGSGAATAWTVTTNPSNLGPFDGVEDTLIGITNSASGTLTSISLTGGVGSGVFAFDGDGACIGTYSPGPTAAQCPVGGFTGADPFDYASAGASFGAYTADSGIVNVSLANGASTWFDLEGVINAQQLSSTPEPGSLVLFGSGLLGLAAMLRRKLGI